MRRSVTLIFLLSSLCLAQESGSFQPSATNVWGADYPRVDNTGRVEVRVKVPDAIKVKLNFWSGPKLDMAKQPDRFWTITTLPLVPGFHYYTLIIDGAEVAIPILMRILAEASPQVRWKFQSPALTIIRSRMCSTARFVSFVQLEGNGNLAARAGATCMLGCVGECLGDGLRLDRWSFSLRV